MSGILPLAGIVGDPITHSISPPLHSYWLGELGLPGRYVPLYVRTPELSVAINSLRKIGFVGLNVTLPHKHAAYALSHTLDDAARKTGAVNLLLFRNGQIEGRNTDVIGLRLALEEEFGRGLLVGRHAVLLGAGGAARAAVIALDQLEMARVSIVARRESAAEVLSTELQRHTRTQLAARPWAELPNALEDAAIVVNATSGGMRGKSPISLSLGELPKNAVVYDLVYGPIETELIRAAEATGHRAAGGLGMLLHQAVPAFAAFYGVTPKVTAGLRQELEKVLHS